MPPEKGSVAESPPYLVSHCHVGQQHELLDQPVWTRKEMEGEEGDKVSHWDQINCVCIDIMFLHGVVFCP